MKSNTILTAPLSKSEVATMLQNCYGALKAMAHRYYSDRDNALDLVQDTICKVLVSESLDGVRCKSDLLGLCSLTMRSVRYNDWKKYCNVHNVSPATEDDYGASEPIFCAEASTDIETIRSAAMHDVRISAALLKAEGYTEKEIADLHGVPLGTAKSRINSGRKALRNVQ